MTDRAGIAELRAAGRLVGDGVGNVVRIVGDTHAAVSRRVGDLLPPVATPVHTLAHGATATVYAVVDEAQRVVSAVAAEVLVQTREASSPPLSRTGFGRAVIPAVNGLWGDWVHGRHPELTVAMSVRSGGEDVVADIGGLAEAFPGATGDLVVFVHGLGEGDRSWWFREGAGPGEGDGIGSYGDRLASSLGVTPVYLRYNSGRRVGDSGRALAGLMSDVVRHWPVPVRAVSFVGHSMGGLVVRSACQHGADAGDRWVEAVSTVVCLGTPHRGAPLERMAEAADQALHRLPETAPLGRVLRSRSDGIRDLRHGAVTLDAEAGSAPAPHRAEAGLLPHVTYRHVAATLMPRHRHPLGRLLGDGMVLYPSAAGPSGTHVGSVSHLGLLNHPEVDALLREWLGASA